jgi:hypothetical protein
MSIESQPYEGQVFRRKKTDKSHIPSRSSYTPSNAEDVRPVFDKMIATRQNQKVYTKDTDRTPSTLYLKFNDGLKFLCENDLGKDKYAMPKSQIHIRKEPDGILCYFRATAENIIKAASATSVVMSKEWKVELQQWLTDAKPEDVFFREHVVISAEDKQWAVSYLSQIEGVEMDIGTDYVKVMR